MRHATCGGIQRQLQPITVHDRVSEQSDRAVGMKELGRAHVSDPPIDQRQHMMPRQCVTCDVAVVDGRFRHDVGTPVALKRSRQERHLRGVPDEEHRPHIPRADRGAGHRCRPCDQT